MTEALSLPPPPEAVASANGAGEARAPVPGGNFNILMLVWRLPLRTRLLTLANCVAAPIPMMTAFLLGWGKFERVRAWHPYAGLVGIILLVAIHFGLQFSASRRVYAHVEDAVADVRASILRLVATSEAPILRGLGEKTVDSVVNGDARLVTAMMPTIMLATEFVFSVLVGLCFAVPLSPWAALLFVVSGILSFKIGNAVGDVLPVLHEADAPERRFHEVVSDLLAGPRELALDRAKGADAAAVAEAFQRKAASIRTAAGSVFGVSLTLIQVFGALFVITCRELSTSRLGEHFAILVVILLAVVQGRFGYLLMNTEQLRGAARAARHLRALEAGLASAPRVADSARSFVGFNEITLSAVRIDRAVRTSGADAFVFGPADVSIPRGTVTLVRGHNGSGKSTLLEVLMGLTKPLSGAIQVDREPIHSGDVAAYRALFSPVFATPHLYDRLYGHETYDPALAKEWLARLDLPPDILLDASAARSTALSTGQRKRLALARAILEGRPVLVLDEYTADQDVAARERFFDDVLPRLKEAGRTTIAIVHEDVRPACVDQYLRVEAGRVVQVARAGDSI